MTSAAAPRYRCETDDAARLSVIGSALAAPVRSAFVCALLSGTAHTTTELARHCGVAMSTASEHIGALIDTGLVATVAQGRHRYHRLASTEVAAAIEALAASLPDHGQGPPGLPSVPAKLRQARSCYDHIAGRLGVAIHDCLIGRGWATGDALTDAGRAGFSRLGIEVGRRSSQRSLRPCLDWSERRHHFAGTAAADLLTHALDRGWLSRSRTERRVLVVSAAGRKALSDATGVTWSAEGTVIWTAATSKGVRVP